MGGELQISYALIGTCTVYIHEHFMVTSAPNAGRTDGAGSYHDFPQFKIMIRLPELIAQNRVVLIHDHEPPALLVVR